MGIIRQNVNVELGQLFSLHFFFIHFNDKLNDSKFACFISYLFLLLIEILCASLLKINRKESKLKCIKIIGELQNKTDHYRIPPFL